MLLCVDHFVMTNEKYSRQPVHERGKAQVEGFEERIESIFSGEIRRLRSLGAMVFHVRETT